MNSNNSIYAIIKNDIVVNVIIAETLEIAQSLFPNNEVLDATDDPYLAMDCFRENNKWFPKKPEPYINLETNAIEPYLWHETTNSWLTQKQIDFYEETKDIVLPIVE